MTKYLGVKKKKITAWCTELFCLAIKEATWTKKWNIFFLNLFTRFFLKKKNFFFCFLDGETPICELFKKKKIKRIEHNMKKSKVTGKKKERVIGRGPVTMAVRPVASMPWVTCSAVEDDENPEASLLLNGHILFRNNLNHTTPCQRTLTHCQHWST